MGLIKSDETLPEQPVIIYLYGDPGCYKTSLAQTCKEPLTIDFNRAIKRAVGRKDSIVFNKGEGWKELMQWVSEGVLDNFKTIIWDTAKDALDDFLVAFVIEQDYRLKTNTLKMYGKIAEEFKIFLNICRSKGLDLLIIAHAKSSEQGDNVKQIANVTGQSNALLYQVCDQMGYVTTKNGQVVIDFQRNDNFLTKNVAGLTQLVLPHFTTPEWENYGEREIFAPVRSSLLKMTDEQEKALDIIQGWRFSIDALIESPDNDNTILAKEITETYAEIAKLTPEHLKKQISAYFLAHLKKIGWKWDKNEGKGAFVNTKAVATEPVQPETKPVEEAKAGEPVNTPATDESNPAALTAPKEDLFAATPDKK